ncbi:MAG: phosphatidylglycerophosphatase A [Candidatus Omnitrophota bacterium]
MKFLHKLIATVFYIGYIPFAPGTFSSIAAIILYCFIKNNPLAMGAAIISCLLLGFLSAGKAEDIFRSKDSRKIVIDEFTGMLVSLFFLPVNAVYTILAFALFRILDIIKPAPAGSLEKLKGSAGIMLDDIVVGIYTNLMLRVLNLIV